MGTIKKYTKQEALAHARRALEEGRIVPTRHLKDRMSERGFSMHDVFAVFENGQINEPPRWDYDHHSLECKVEGYDIEGDELSIVFAIDEEGPYSLNHRNVT